jgi:hypothetical protein
MDHWVRGKFDMLVHETEHAVLLQLSQVRGAVAQEQQAKTFARLVLQGKL